MAENPLLKIQIGKIQIKQLIAYLLTQKILDWALQTNSLLTMT